MRSKRELNYLIMSWAECFFIQIIFIDIDIVLNFVRFTYNYF